MDLLSKLIYICLLASADCVASDSQTTNKASIFELKNGNLSIKVTNYGAHLISLVYPDKYGKLDDVILGYDTIKEYKEDKGALGATLGRVSNRIANASFTLNGVTYKLEANEGNNTLHSGSRGFNKVLWKVKEYLPKAKVPRLVLFYNSFDGEQGFPGALRVLLTYKLHGDNKVSITAAAKALNKATPVNVVQHPYWNLGGHASGDILSEELQIFASSFTPTDAHLIPTGAIVPVKGTPYDFLEPATIGSRFGKLAYGYDINYALDGKSFLRDVTTVAFLYDKKTGRRLELMTNQPGLQFYSGNYLNTTGKGGAFYKAHAGLALETQGFPNAVNLPNFPSQIVNPGQIYKHYMIMKFYAG